MSGDAGHRARVFFFGDSICFGQGVSLHKGWVTRVAHELAELGQRAGREVMVVNASINGNTTRQALERMPYDIQTQAADVLLVQFGMNDCNYWESDRGNPRVSPGAFEANLEEIIARARTCGTRSIVLNTNHPTGRDHELMAHTNVTYEESNRAYNAIIRKVARRHAGSGVDLNDVEERFHAATAGDRDALVELLLPDLLHLSEQGHDLYFAQVFPTVERAVLALLDS